MKVFVTAFRGERAVHLHALHIDSAGSGPPTSTSPSQINHPSLLWRMAVDCTNTNVAPKARLTPAPKRLRTFPLHFSLWPFAVWSGRSVGGCFWCTEPGNGAFLWNHLVNCDVCVMYAYSC